LTLLLATPEKDDIIVLLSKINAIARTEIHSELVKASAKTLAIAEISNRNPAYPHLDRVASPLIFQSF